jgi:hypothetical protein
MDDLTSMKPKGGKAKLLLLGDFDPQNVRIIRDPYYDRGSQGIYSRIFYPMQAQVKNFEV